MVGAHKRIVCKIHRFDLTLRRGDMDSVHIEMSLAEVKVPKLPMFVSENGLVSWPLPYKVQINPI